MKNGKSLRIFWLFTSAVVLLIAISLLFKIYTVITKSLFDGTHRFTVLQKTNPVRIYSFAPDVNQITLLDIETKSDKATQRDIKIPIDVIVAGKKTDKIGDRSDSVGSYLQDLFFHYNQIQTQMTLIDIARLWFFTQSVDQNEILYKKIDTAVLSDENVFDKMAMELFLDDAIATENLSIQIVNATGVFGAGHDFARIFSNIGGNVISVTTGKKEVRETTIQYYGQSSYTLEKVEKMLMKKAVKSKKQHISDIIIILGKDRVE